MIHELKILTLTLAVLSLSACSMFGGDSDPLVELREVIRATVHDQERAEAMLASIDQLDQLLIESGDLLAETFRQDRLLFADYDSTPQDFELLYSETARRRQKLQDEMLDVHLAFKSSTTADEWEAIRSLHAAAISSRVESLVAAARESR